MNPFTLRRIVVLVRRGVNPRIHLWNIREGSLDFVGEANRRVSPEEGAVILAQRALRPDLNPAANLPDDTRLWAALQQAGGGTWGGCVYDVESVLALLEAGRKSLSK